MINKILANAAKYLGTPYVWGGESEKEGGFDCSGFVFNVLRDSGYNVPRDTAQGYFNRFKANRIYSVESSALLFFGKSTNKITHIAIAIDNTFMYESIGGRLNTKFNKGKGVTMSKITRRKDLIAICKVDKEVISYYPAYKGAETKLDYILKAIDAPCGSLEKRKPLALANDIKDYKGTYEQNIKLIKLAKAGKLRRV